MSELEAENKQFNMYERLLSEGRPVRIAVAAGYLGVHPQTLRRYVNNGFVRAIRLPGSGERRFLPDYLRELKARMYEDVES